MEKKKVNVEEPVKVSGLTMIPITRTLVCGWQDHRRLSFLGLKRPLYVLVLRPEAAVKAFDSEGKEVPLELILSRYPEIKERIQVE